MLSVKSYQSITSHTKMLTVTSEQGISRDTKDVSSKILSKHNQPY